MGPSWSDWRETAKIYRARAEEVYLAEDRGRRNIPVTHIPRFWPIYLLIKKQAENNRSNVVFFFIFGLALGKEVLDAKGMDIFFLML